MKSSVKPKRTNVRPIAKNPPRVKFVPKPKPARKLRPMSAPQETKHVIGPAPPHVSRVRKLVQGVGNAGRSVDISSEQQGVRTALSTLHPELVRGAKVADAVTSSTATIATTQNYTFNTVNYGSGRFEWGMQICPCLNDQLVIPSTWAGGVITTTGFADNYAYAALTSVLAEFRLVSMSFELTNNTNGLNVQGRWSVGNTRSGLAPLNGTNFDAYSSVPNYVKGTFTVDKPSCRMVWLASDEADRFFKSLTATVPTADQTALVLFVESGGITNTFNLMITCNWEVIPVQSAQTYVPTTAAPCNVSTFTDSMSAGVDQAVRGQDRVTDPDKADASVGSTLATMAKAAIGVAGDVLTDIPGLGKVAEKALGPVADTIGSAVNFFADGIGSLFGMSANAEMVLRHFIAAGCLSDEETKNVMDQLIQLDKQLDLKIRLATVFAQVNELKIRVETNPVRRRRPDYTGLSAMVGNNRVIRKVNPVVLRPTNGVLHLNTTCETSS